MNETMNGSQSRGKYDPDSTPTPKYNPEGATAFTKEHEREFSMLNTKVDSLAESILKIVAENKKEASYIKEQLEALKKTEAAADQLARNAMVALIASEGRAFVRDIFDMTQEAKESSAQIEGERIKERVGFLKFLVESKLPAELLREIISALPNTESHVFEAGHKGAQQVMKQLGAALVK